MTERLHLLPRHRRMLEALLQEHLPDVEVWAYGSRVDGRGHDGSDLDLVLRGPDLERLPVDTLADFEEAVRESNIPFLVEAHDWAYLPERFHHEIEQDHVVFSKKELRGENSGWRAVALGDVTELLSGGTPSKGEPTYWNGTIPWVSAKDMKRFRLQDTADRITAEGLANGTRQVPAGSVLLLTRGMTLLNELPVCVTERPMAFNQDVKALRPKPGIDPAFLPYLVLGNKERFLSLVDLAGHGTGRINTDELKSLEVQLPPPAEQRTTAHVLRTLDDKIELNRRMNETLEAMVRALFKSWFVDFEPVRAKMEGWDAGLPPRLASLFPNRLVHSELGEIPDGWNVLPLDELALFQNGLALQNHRPTKNENRLPVVKIAQLRSGQPNSGEWATESIPSECKIDDGDIIFSWSGSLLLKIWCGGSAALNQHLFKVISKRYPKWFVFYSVRSHLLNFQSIASGTATTLGHIRRHHLSDAKCAVPNRQFLTAIDGLFCPLLSKIVSNELQSRTLIHLRDTILPSLVSGEFQIDNIRNHFAGAE